MKFTPSATARRSSAIAPSAPSAGAIGGPQIPGPVIRIAPKPRRSTAKSPIVIVPAALIDAASWDRQVAVELPAGHLHAVLLPFAALDLHVAVEGVLAERAQRDLRVGGQLDRRTERLGQLLDAPAATFLG